MTEKQIKKEKIIEKQLEINRKIEEHIQSLIDNERIDDDDKKIIKEYRKIMVNAKSLY
jgi:hypothetical protein